MKLDNLRQSTKYKINEIINRGLVDITFISLQWEKKTLPHNGELIAL